MRVYVWSVMVGAILGVACGGKKGPPPLCASGSSCTERHYCNATQSCRCIKSAEGEIRCGETPSCGVRLCTKSSDCADLGPGYFCDSPNSGCCSDAQKSRCIAPCMGETCPETRICNGKCCAAGETCVAGKCSSGAAPDASTRDAAADRPVDAPVTPDAARDAAVDAPMSDSGRDGAGGTGGAGGGGAGGAGGSSTGPGPTAAQMEAAAAALAGGATDVMLTPDGIWRYQRTTAAGTRTDKLLVSGKEVLVFEHMGDRSVGRQDADGDGVFEWETEAMRSASPTEGRVTTTRYTGNPRVPSERTTYTRMGDMVTVALEQSDAGALKKVREFTKPLETDRAGATIAQAGCTPADCDPAALKDKLRMAADQGLVCLHGKGANDLEMRLTNAYMNNKIEVKCGKLGMSMGRQRLATTLTPLPFPLDLDPHGEIVVDDTAFCGLGATDQLAVLFHELTHFDDPSHVPEQETDPRRADVDRMYACQDLCFKPPSSVTQCACATCLNTTKCDKRCDTSLGFQMCPDDMGAWCPCLSRLKWYPKCSDCLANCPSGLACFGISTCVPVNKGRCTPATCP
jgi:hypothetical protein